ncbi:rhamnogalacturonan lyase [Brevundimonas sp. R86498]|uniref:rhamnogalacturonan lyase n=1 Tax=Brevundimonas sp. R86498 TaxID=3093845 RepID=UPI0037CA9198
MRSLKRCLATSLLCMGVAAGPVLAEVPSPPRRAAENLDRGVVAVPAVAGGVLISWRLRSDDTPDTGFDVYRDGTKLNPHPIVASTNFVDTDGVPTAGSYSVQVSGANASATTPVQVWANGYLSIPLQQPLGGINPDGTAFTYNANDASVGDLDGDGRYEIVLKWDPSTSRDNAFSGYSGPAILDAYTLEGQRLWRIDLGPNIRAGAHYTQFLVFDFDGDGRAEVVAKTADGTIDGQGGIVGDAAADWRERGGEAPQADRTGAALRPDGSRYADLTGRILRGPEYLTVFDGQTGRAVATEAFTPARDPDTATPTAAQLTERWGDGYGNRSDRYLAGVAYLDGQRPSIVMGRGYYARTTVSAWDWRDGTLSQRWLFDSGSADDAFSGQGNHQLAVADVDEDGRDEIVYGAMALDDDGTGLWSAQLFHGDALHLSDLDPERPGLERFGVHESPGRNGGVGSAMLDARTGGVLWSTPADRDVGRGLAADIDPRHPGAEAWAIHSDTLMTAAGQPIGPRPAQINFAIWWDGDLLRELLDGTTIRKWNWETATSEPLLVASGAASNNGTKANPALSADLVGDWREEVILRAADNSELRLYATPYPTDVRLVTLMQDPVYRLAVAWQNTSYNQPPHVGFYLGTGMTLPRP